MNTTNIDLSVLTDEEKTTYFRLIEKATKLTNPTNINPLRVKEGEHFYVLAPDGDIKSYEEHYRYFEDKCFKFGNYFKTDSGARFAKLKQLTYQKLKAYASKYNKGMIDWLDGYQAKWFIRYDHINEALDYSWVTTGRVMNQIYFTSEEVARNAINFVGEDDIVRYLFDVLR